MLHVLNFFKNISYRVSTNSYMRDKILKSIPKYHTNRFFLKKNRKSHKINHKYDFNIFLSNFLFNLELNKKIIFNKSFLLLKNNSISNIKTQNNIFYKNDYKKNILDSLNNNLINFKNKKSVIKLKINQIIKKNNIVFFDKHQKQNILNKFVPYNTKIEFINEKLKNKKISLLFFNPILKNFMDLISLKYIVSKNFKTFLNNDSSMLDERRNQTDSFFTKKISILKKKTDSNSLFIFYNKDNYINLGNKIISFPIIKTFNLNTVPYIKLDFFYRNRIWKKAINYDFLTKIHNINYVIDLKLYQEYLGCLFLRLKMNLRDKSAKFYFFSKSCKIRTILKSSISFLKNIFKKNNMQLSEVIINNKCYSQYQKNKLKKKNSDNIVKISDRVEYNKNLNSVLFSNKKNFQNVFFSYNKIDIYT